MTASLPALPRSGGNPINPRPGPAKVGTPHHRGGLAAAAPTGPHTPLLEVKVRYPPLGGRGGIPLGGYAALGLE